MRPGTASETDEVLRRAVAGDGLHYVRVVEQTNSESFPDAGLHVVRRGSGATVVALGPVLDEVLEATAGRDVTVLYAHSVRPFDARTFRSVLTSPEVVLVEPWLAGTSARCVADALVDAPASAAGPGHAPDRAAALRQSRPSTSAPTASTPPGSGAPSTRSWLRDRAASRQATMAPAAVRGAPV